MKPTLINLTPHDIVIQLSATDTEVKSIIIPPTAPMARVEVSTVEIGHVDGIPLVIPTYGETTGLPDPQPGVFLIVSNIVLAANKNRFDLLTPSRPIRDEAGKVIACGALSVVDPMSELMAAAGTDGHANALYLMKKANQ